MLFAWVLQEFQTHADHAQDVKNWNQATSTSHHTCTLPETLLAKIQASASAIKQLLIITNTYSMSDYFKYICTGVQHSTVQYKNISF